MQIGLARSFADGHQRRHDRGQDGGGHRRRRGSSRGDGGSGSGSGGGGRRKKQSSRASRQRRRLHVRGFLGRDAAAVAAGARAHHPFHSFVLRHGRVLCAVRCSHGGSGWLLLFDFLRHALLLLARVGWRAHFLAAGGCGCCCCGRCRSRRCRRCCWCRRRDGCHHSCAGWRICSRTCRDALLILTGSLLATTRASLAACRRCCCR